MAAVAGSLESGTTGGHTGFALEAGDPLNYEPGTIDAGDLGFFKRSGSPLQLEQYADGTGGGSDIGAPVVTSINPAAGDSISRTQTITFSVTDPEGADVVIAVVGVIYPGGAAEWVYDGSVFFVPFLSSTATPRIDGGVDFSITRTGGWPDLPTFRCRPVDAEGNV